MHVVEPVRYLARPKTRRWKPYAAVAVGLVLATGVVNYFRPLPAANLEVRLSAPPAVSPSLSWPSSGQSAIAAEHYGLLDTFGTQSPIATASTAKVITALCVLSKEPLAPGQSGPEYTVDQQDVQNYENYVSEDGSLVPVQQGEKITEYQALEALMIPSANNMADSLVKWVFGSQSAYATYASEFLQENGLDNTHIGSDASGFDPSTTSTASDLSQLGLLAMQNPILTKIAGQTSATLPLAGRVTNYDTVLGQNGITGLKTGNSTSDTGAFIFTATATVGSTSIPITGAIMGAPDLNTALQESVKLAGSFEQNFSQASVADSGQKVGTFQTAWGAASPIVTEGALSLVRWNATPITTKYHVDTRLRKGTVGTLKATAGPSSSSIELRLSHGIAAPAFWWRLTRH